MKKEQEIWTVLKVLDWTRGYLAERGVENARLETEWMLCASLGLDRVGLYVNHDKPLTTEELAAFRDMVARRAKREPLQYVLGSQEFMGLEIEVSPAVLIPRHDTETLVEEAVRRCPEAKRVLDVGVGSGCVAIALAKALPRAEVFGVDTSGEALEMAGRNAVNNGVTIAFYRGSLFENLDGMRFDLVVSNPPYIPTGDIAGLQPEVRDYEPIAALDGGADGLDFYRSMIPLAPNYLNSRGWLLFEAGIYQSPRILEFFGKEKCYGELFAAKDAGGVERVVGGRLVS